MESESHIAVPPGATIAEQLEYRGMIQEEFAARMGMSPELLGRLMSGEARLTTGRARKLEMVLGIPASFWRKLEARYREQLACVLEEKDGRGNQERQPPEAGGSGG